MNKRYGLKAINDEETVCTVCGKLELKKVMWLVELDTDGNEVGEEFHAGTTCGAKLMSQKISLVNKVVKNFESTVYKMKSDYRRKIERELGADEIIETWNKNNVSFSERRNSEEWARLTEITAKAHEAANNQKYIVEVV